MILLALKISVSESSALLSRLITPLPMKLVTMTKRLPTLYIKEKNKKSCFPDGPENTTTVKSEIDFVVFMLPFF